MAELTREEFLKRCETIYDKGLASSERLRLLEQWVDAVMRAEAVIFGADHGGTQMSDVWQFLTDEAKRTGHPIRAFIPSNGDSEPYVLPPSLNGRGLLANDTVGYGLCELAAILTHHCQICAENPEAWHTRSGFCPHRNWNEADVSEVAATIVKKDGD